MLFHQGAHRYRPAAGAVDDARHLVLRGHADKQLRHLGHGQVVALLLAAGHVEHVRARFDSPVKL